MKQFHPTFITLTFCLATSWLQAMDESISTPQLRAEVASVLEKTEINE